MWASFLSGKLFVASFDYKTQFKRRSFHVPNLIPPIKYMKRSTFESISPAYLIWVDPWVKVAQMGISTEEWLRFKGRTFHAPNLMHKLLPVTYFNW